MFMEYNLTTDTKQHDKHAINNKFDLGQLYKYGRRMMVFGK